MIWTVMEYDRLVSPPDEDGAVHYATLAPEMSTKAPAVGSRVRLRIAEMGDDTFVGYGLLAVFGEVRGGEYLLRRAWTVDYVRPTRQRCEEMTFPSFYFGDDDVAPVPGRFCRVWVEEVE